MNSLQSPPINDDNLEYSLRHLVAYDLKAIRNLDEAEKITKFNLQNFVKKISQMPSKRATEDGLLIDLPKTSSLLIPRILPVPKEKKPSKWQKFAQEKGIEKKKRSRYVWDEEGKEWAPRWGYKSISKLKKKRENTVIEMKEGENIRDVYEGIRREADIKKTKQKLREVRNEIATNSVNTSSKMSKVSKQKESLDKLKPPQTDILTPVYDKSQKTKFNGKKELSEKHKKSNTNKQFGIKKDSLNQSTLQERRNNVNTLLKRAQTSTASFGRHDKQLNQEPNKPKIYQKITHQTPKQEQNQYSQLMDKIMKSSQPTNA